MNSYKLLTPGPLTTTDTVKQVMLFDHCTWDDDYKQITQTIRRTLLALGHVSEPEYTAVLMQGSGTFGVATAVASSNQVLMVVAVMSGCIRLITLAHTSAAGFMGRKTSLNEVADKGARGVRPRGV